MAKVKICGITRLEDALAAVDAGADYLGFIFYPPSPRAIEPEAAGNIVRALRAHPRFAAADAPRLVGVFVNEPAPAAAAVLDACDLDLAQLSGDESAADVTDPTSPLFGRAYKALRPRSPDEAQAQAGRFAAPAGDGPVLLLDTPHGALYGGSGATGDWTVAAALSIRLPRLMLAGGLTPDNVAAAVARAHPWAVDVASGVEALPGRKDPTLIRAFVANAR
mgnify:CR=1 FL=1